MQKTLNKLFASTFLRFLFAGGTAAAVNFGSRFLFSQWCVFSVAVVLAYLAGMITAFLLNRLFVFESARDGHIGKQALVFSLVNLLAVAQTLLISVLLAAWLRPLLADANMAEALAHLVGVIVPVFTSFVGHKYLSFRT